VEAKEYVENAKNTEVQDYSPCVDRISNVETFSKLLNSLLTAAKAAQEINDFKRHIFYGKKLDTRFEGPDVIDVCVHERSQSEEFVRLLHAGIGLYTEAGEFFEALINYLANGELDKYNLAEELGDTCWYVAIGSDATNVPLDNIFQTNIDKLRARFPNKFTEYDSLNRDLDKEREILEDTDK
jgi:NTP pyrophosphatase (non-canonical NTP hydrolase)